MGVQACCPVPLHTTPCSSTSCCLPALEQTQSLGSATGSCSPSLERARALLKPPSSPAAPTACGHPLGGLPQP